MTHPSQTQSVRDAASFLLQHGEDVRFFHQDILEENGTIYELEDYLQNIWDLSEPVAQDAAAMIWEGLA